MGRALAWVAVAIVFGASAWLLVMGVLTALLHSLGLSWLASFAICAALSLGVTGFAAWRVSVFFDHAGMHATRRQPARFGLGDENADAAACDATAPAPPGRGRARLTRTGHQRAANAQGSRGGGKAVDRHE